MCCIECTYYNIEHDVEGVKTHSLANRQRTSVWGILYKLTSICVDIIHTCLWKVNGPSYNNATSSEEAGRAKCDVM